MQDGPGALHPSPAPQGLASFSAGLSALNRLRGGAELAARFAGAAARVARHSAWRSAGLEAPR